MTRNRFRTLSLLGAETALVCACCALAVWLQCRADGGCHWWQMIFLLLVMQGSFYLFDLYDLPLIRQWELLPVRLAQACGVSALVFTVTLRLMPGLMPARGVTALSLLLLLPVMITWRLMARWVMTHPKLAERVLIIGTGRNAVELARETLERREAGYSIVGFAGDDPHLIGQSLINPSVLGLTAELESIVAQHQVERIVVALDDRRGRMPMEALLRLKLRGETVVEEASSFYEKLTGKLSLATLRPGWLIFGESESRWRRLARLLRRGADIIISLAGLALSAPLMLLVAMAIKLDSRGPVFYTQERLGLNSQRFRIIKFRSMTTDAERHGPVWAEHRDARITRTGRLIRKLRLDELPQFINVLRGEMSLVGPRPERPEFVAWLEREIPWYAQRHLIRPGLTGWAQVRYSYGASVDDAREKLRYDLYYLRNQSLLFDLVILLETARVVLFGRQAR